MIHREVTVTQADCAYQGLRVAIVRCEYEPGARLRVEELTKKLSVSNSPLRDALSRLAVDLFNAAEYYRRLSATHRKTRRNKLNEHQKLLQAAIRRYQYAPKLVGEHISATEPNACDAFSNLGVETIE